MPPSASASPSPNPSPSKPIMKSFRSRMGTLKRFGSTSSIRSTLSQEAESQPHGVSGPRSESPESFTKSIPHNEPKSTPAKDTVDPAAAKLANDIAAAETQLSSTNLRVEEATAELHRTSEKLQSARDELSQVQAALTSAQEDTRAREELEAFGRQELARVQADLAAIREKIEAARVSRDGQKEAARRELSDVRVDITTAKKELSATREELEVAKVGLTKAVEDSDVVEGKLARARTELENMKFELEQARSESERQAAETALVANPTVVPPTSSSISQETAPLISPATAPRPSATAPTTAECIGFTIGRALVFAGNVIFSRGDIFRGGLARALRS